MNAASVTTFAQFVAKLAQQNNPVELFMAWITTSVYMLATYRSNIKLNKYRQSMYAEQLARMEGYLGNSSPYSDLGQKFNRKY